jgi:hypothetical protein
MINRDQVQLDAHGLTGGKQARACATGATEQIGGENRFGGAHKVYSNPVIS